MQWTVDQALVLGSFAQAGVAVGAPINHSEEVVVNPKDRDLLKSGKNDRDGSSLLDFSYAAKRNQPT